jgi:hypothetical protein
MHDPAPTNVTGGQWWLPSCHVRSLSSFHRLTRDSAVALLVRFYVQVSSPCRLPSVPSVSSGHWTQDQGAAPTYRGLRSETVVLRCPVFLIWETAVLGWPWPVLRAMGVLLFFQVSWLKGSVSWLWQLGFSLPPGGHICKGLYVYCHNGPSCDVEPGCTLYPCK